MLNLNTVTLAGNLTRDPEVKFLANEKVVAKFAIAINRRSKGPDGEQKEDTTFVEIEAWNRTGELVGQYLKKGSAVYIEGTLKMDRWETQDGQKRQRLGVLAYNVQFLGQPSGHKKEHTPPKPVQAPAEHTPQPKHAPVAANLLGNDDEVPF